MKLFISGPMTDRPEHNHPAFHAIAARLRAGGHEVESPAENTPPECGTWAGWMRLSIAQMCKCDAVILLKGWEASDGALWEYRIANMLRISTWAEDLVHCLPAAQTCPQCSGPHSLDHCPRWRESA